MRPIREYNFREACFEWGRIPIDGIGYIPAGALCKMPSYLLAGLLKEAQKERYSLTGWRNFQNKWREKLGLDSIKGKTILDFGCGLGIESLEFAKNGNEIVLVDITSPSLALSEKVLGLNGFEPLEKIQAMEHKPFFRDPAALIDVFYANGVLHHTPTPREILLRACDVLSDDGEIRIMTYSDRGWKIATGQEVKDPCARACDQDENQFKAFVAFFDGVGFYADWFCEEKLERWFGEFLTIVEFDYITDDDRYLVATLRPK